MGVRIQDSHEVEHGDRYCLRNSVETLGIVHARPHQQGISAPGTTPQVAVALPPRRGPPVGAEGIRLLMRPLLLLRQRIEWNAESYLGVTSCPPPTWRYGPRKSML